MNSEYIPSVGRLKVVLLLGWLPDENVCRDLLGLCFQVNASCGAQMAFQSGHRSVWRRPLDALTEDRSAAGSNGFCSLQTTDIPQLGSRMQLPTDIA